MEIKIYLSAICISGAVCYSIVLNISFPGHEILMVWVGDTQHGLREMFSTSVITDNTRPEFLPFVRDAEVCQDTLKPCTLVKIMICLHAYLLG